MLDDLSVLLGFKQGKELEPPLFVDTKDDLFNQKNIENKLFLNNDLQILNLGHEKFFDKKNIWNINKIDPILFNNPPPIIDNFNDVAIKSYLQTDISLDHLSDEDQDWAVQIKIRSRQDVVKIAAILGRAISLSDTAGRSLSIGVEGGVNTGKTLVCDIILFELLDRLSPYTVPKRNCQYLETKPDDGLRSPISKRFDIAGRREDVTFVNYGGISPNAAKILKQKSRLLLVTFNKGIGKVDTTTEICDLSLFIAMTKTGSGIWDSQWTIYVAPELRTPEMKERIDHLKAVAKRINPAKVDVRLDIAA